MEHFDLFARFEWEYLVRVVLAVILGGAIGLEREFSGRPAGLRTHILVCMGATLIVLASTAVPRLFGNNFQEIVRIDPGRIAAGIVTGIGFLGAGAIIRTREFIRGLTTAACIWFAAALGIVIGEGFYLLAVLGTVVVLVVLRVDELFEYQIRSPVYRTLRARVSESHWKAFDEQCRLFLKNKRIRIQDVGSAYDGDSHSMEMKYHIRTRHSSTKSREVVGHLKEAPGVISLRWEI